MYCNLTTPEEFDKICEDIEDEKVREALLAINNMLQSGEITFCDTDKIFKSLRQGTIYSRVKVILINAGWRLPDMKRGGSIYNLERKEK